jgi:hypothetical protein
MPNPVHHTFRRPGSQISPIARPALSDCGEEEEETLELLDNIRSRQGIAHVTTPSTQRSNSTTHEPMVEPIHEDLANSGNPDFIDGPINGGSVVDRYPLSDDDSEDLNPANNEDGSDDNDPVNLNPANSEHASEDDEPTDHDPVTRERPAGDEDEYVDDGADRIGDTEDEDDEDEEEAFEDIQDDEAEIERNQRRRSSTGEHMLCLLPDIVIDR